MSPGEKILLRRANSVYLRQWTDALVSADSVKLRLYAQRLDEIRMCREAKSISDEFRRHLMGLFQSRVPEGESLSEEPPSFRESDDDQI